MYFLILIITLFHWFASCSCFLQELTTEEKLYWHNQAQQLHWFAPYQEVISTTHEFPLWFVGGKLNASYACLDTHINNGQGDRIAIKWINEQNQEQVLSYKELYVMVNNLAHCLESNGVHQGDRVLIYLPMAPCAIAAILACARLGAPHVVVFSGFGAPAIKERIIDCQANYIITTEKSCYRGKSIELNKTVDLIAKELDQVKKIFLITRDHENYVPGPKTITYDPTKDRSDMYIKPVEVESNHPLFILYTSGTTGKPKGIVHSTGGYLTYVSSTIKSAFDITQNDIYWCTADIGWITGHSYGVYGPLMHGATIVMREGAPDYPDIRAWFTLIDRYKISLFYTSPTALRMFMRFDQDKLFNNLELSSLRILGSVGEPIAPAVWQWYFEHIGKNRCPIIDTWWQTETGGIMISPTAKTPLDKLKPGSASTPLPGIQADITDAQGHSAPEGQRGLLVITKPWPGMMLGIYNNNDNFKKVYWSQVPGAYYTGDYAIKDQDGYFWLLGRADEILKISGHRIGTAQVEYVVAMHEAIAESAAIGIPDEIKGNVLVLFCVLKDKYEFSNTIGQELDELIRSYIGSFASPKGIYFVEKLPKTRSGKILRRVLQALLTGQALGDISTCDDESSVAEIQDYIRLYAQQITHH